MVIYSKKEKTGQTVVNRLTGRKNNGPDMDATIAKGLVKEA
ncbi:hypothetical protein ADIS_4252 [Lunatimonas lonarensis]|uniref:Uncharacterized protein n=1 Tax=Lunatimonas lonarensis TaxID=1232681 RepID=R7ZLW8_9BACT|nr:hypothetical protein ADIS_4252 [Lunatimonas lonarensis]